MWHLSLERNRTIFCLLGEESNQLREESNLSSGQGLLSILTLLSSWSGIKPTPRGIKPLIWPDTCPWPVQGPYGARLYTRYHDFINIFYARREIFRFFTILFLNRHLFFLMQAWAGRSFKLIFIIFSLYLHLFF